MFARCPDKVSLMSLFLLYFALQFQFLLFGLVVHGDCEVVPGCQDQGEYLQGVLKSYGLDPDTPVHGVNTCVFRLLRQPRTCLESRESFLQTNWMPSFPDSQWWSRCQHCTWSSVEGRFQVYNETVPKDSASVVDLTASLWGEFFFESQNDFIQAEILDKKEDKAPNLFIERPVFLLPLISLHPGHVIVDVLEQVYGAMMKAYGKVRRDSLLLLDVSNEEERSVLSRKIYVNTRYAAGFIGEGEDAVMVDSYASVLGVLSELPVVTLESLNSLPAGNSRVLFKDIHVGIDNFQGFFHHGHRYHPCLMSGAGHSAFFRKLSARYQQFQSYIHSFYSQTSPRVDGPVNLTFVQRTPSLHKSHAGEVPSVAGGGNSGPSNRLILNVASLATKAKEMGHTVTTLTLEDMPFTTQLQLFHQTDVLVATAGSALHNVLFMRRGSSVVIIMQRWWQQWSWMFANQALLLDMRVFVYVDNFRSTKGSQCLTAHWSRHFWRVGPRAAKSSNIRVDEDVFERILTEAGDFSVEGVQSYRRRVNTADEGCTSGIRTFYRQKNDSKSSLSGELADLGCKRKFNESEVPVVRVLVSAVKIDKSSQEWKVRLMGAFEYSVEYAGDTVMHEFFASMPHLSLCVQVLGSSMEMPGPGCLPLDSFNYYSELHVNFDVSVSPMQSLHVWMQATPQSGKLLGSDTFVALDLRVPDGGWLLSQHQEHSGFRVAPSPCNGEDSVSVIIVGPTGESERVVSFSLLSPWDFQRDVSSLCRIEGLDPETCSKIVSSVTARLEQCRLSSALGLPPVQNEEPSRSSPFIFLHIEKTGGTTLRELITDAAEKRGLTSLVPCHGGIHCTVLNIHDLFHYGQQDLLQEVAVVAGHFFWGVWRQLPHWAIASITSPSSPDNEAVPHLLVMGRHPVDRAISYYYQRCYQVEHCRGYKRMINNLLPEELLEIGLNERHGQYSPLDPRNETIVLLDEGMSDAACRVLSGRRATSGHTQSLMGEGGTRFNTTLPTPGTLPPEALVEATKHLNQCVVGLQERWADTLAVMRRWFPWLSGSLDHNKRKMHLFSGKEDRHALLPELRSVLEGINRCDMALYEAMERRFEQQMQVLEYS